MTDLVAFDFAVRDVLRGTSDLVRVVVVNPATPFGAERAAVETMRVLCLTREAREFFGAGSPRDD